MIFTGNFGNHSRKKWFSVIAFFAFLCAFFPFGSWAQSAQHVMWSDFPFLNDNYTVEIQTQPATCYFNGKVGFIIKDKHGNPVDSTTIADVLHLSDFQMGYKGTSIDTSLRWKEMGEHPSSGWNWVQMDFGTYDFILEMYCDTSTTSAPAYVIVNATAHLDVELQYVDPSFSVMMKPSYDGVSLGNIPALKNCSNNTGRIQLIIEGDSHPYHVTVVNHLTGETLRDSTFYHPQHYGTDPERADYVNYYSINDMPAGDWDFYLLDGCQYEKGPMRQVVDSIELPGIEDVQVYASSGNVGDSNIVKVRALLKDSRYSVYLDKYAPCMEYRFLVEGKYNPGQVNSIPFHPLFPNGYNGETWVTLYDTVPNAVKYCDQIWEKLITLQVRVPEICSDCGTIITEDTFRVHNTNPGAYTREYETVTESSSPVGCSQTLTVHNDNFSIWYEGWHPDYRTAGGDHNKWRYHFTYPIVWTHQKYVGSVVIKRDTIWGIEDWDNIARKSTFTIDDIEDNVQYAFPDPRATLKVQSYLTDAKGCELVNKIYDVAPNPRTENGATPQWTTSSKDPVCPDQLRSITVFENFGIEGSSYDGMTIELVDCPDPTLYKFRATYSEESHSWTLENTGGTTLNYALIYNTDFVQGSSNGNSLKIQKKALPSGTYEFHITGAPCHQGETITVTRYLQGLVHAELAEPLKRNIVPHCHGVYVRYDSGRVRKTTTSRDYMDNNIIEYEYDTVDTHFEMVSGPLGGYDPLDHGPYHVKGAKYTDANGHTQTSEGDSIRITVVSETVPYIFRIFPKSSDGLCGDFDVYDTVYYTGNSVKHDFAFALVCNREDHNGSVYMRAMNGVPPYHYYLYSDTSKTQLVADTVLPRDSVAVFYNVHMNIDSQLACRVVDYCGNSFVDNFYPQSLAEVQKTWFDGGAKTLDVCEGTFIHLHALQAGLIFKYRWYKVSNDPNVPDTLMAETANPEFFISRGSDTATYRVEIYETGCGSAPLSDSVTVYPWAAPKVALAANPMEVCPGEKATISFTPISYYFPANDNKPSPIDSFTVVIESPLGRESRTYYNKPSGVPIYDSIFPVMATNIYVTEVSDGRCDYQYTDTVLTVRISNHVITPCQIFTYHDTVCYDGDARLGAQCSAGTPFTIRWWNDFSLTDFVGEDVITNSSDTSIQMLNNLTSRKMLFVSVDKADFCPASNLVADSAVNMDDMGVTTMACTQSVLFYDDGGPDHPFQASEEAGTVMTHLFVSSDGRPMTIHFDELNLSPTSYMIFFSGTTDNPDSLLYVLSEGNEAPDVIVSNGNAILVIFAPGEESADGWMAHVRPSPGIAIGDVYNRSTVIFRDTVCQSHFNDYSIPSYIPFEVQKPSDIALLPIAPRTAGHHLFERHDEDIHECDSVTILDLYVTPAPASKIDMVKLSTDPPVSWGEAPYHFECDTTGQYTTYYDVGEGCDSTAILNLIVLDVSFDDEMCEPYPFSFNINVTTPPLEFSRPRPSVGDVLCTDGTVLRPDSFETSGKTAMGVVFYIDPRFADHSVGLAIALYDAYPDSCDWATRDYISTVHSYPIIQGDVNFYEAMADMDGYGNSMDIMNTSGGYKERAPAWYYCWYYDHTNPTVPGAAFPNHKKWYLPSCGELNYVLANKYMIARTLKLLNALGVAEPLRDSHRYYKDGNFPDTKYWTSTETTSQGSAYSISSNGQLNNRNGKQSDSINPRYVRAVIQFTLSN